MELTEYEQRIGKSRHIEVKIRCEYCGNEKWVKWSRVKIGQGRFCSFKCFGLSENKGNNKLYVGKENGKISFDKTRNSYYVYWLDPDTLKRKTTSYARWWWEMNKGEIPSGYRASYKDGNSLNIDPDNIILISPKEFGNAISKRLMGHGFSDETLRKMSDAKRGKSLSEEHKKHIGEQTKRMWEDGVFDAPHIRDAYFKRGLSTKGSKRTEEQKQRMSEMRKGKSVSQLFTPEAIEKRRQKLIGKPQNIESNLKRSKTLKGTIFTDEHKERLSIASMNRTDLKGENSHWWKGGVSNDPYPPEFGNYLKRKVRKRDKYTCQTCGINVHGSKLGHVHHIDGDKQNCNYNNLLLLCSNCHNIVHNCVTENENLQKLKNLLR